MMQTVVVQGVFQARLYLPQASQLAQCPAGNDTLHLTTTTQALAPSQFFGGSKMVGVNNSREPCCSEWYPVHNHGGGVQVVCMAKERRVKMVAQQIKREISEMLLYDKVLQAAVLPETTLGADMFLTAVATITEVDMSKDLSVAKVYISIYGDDRGQVKALEGLKNRAGYVRKGLAQRMNLKNTPEVRFIKDDALERGSRVIGILDKLKKERRLKEGKDPSGSDEDETVDQEDDIEYEEEDVSKEAEEENSLTTFSRSKDDGDESDWDDAENITFIK